VLLFYLVPADSLAAMTLEVKLVAVGGDKLGELRGRWRVGRSRHAEGAASPMRATPRRAGSMC
jgi:hypothetical protein